MLVLLVEFDYREETEAEKSINAWRQSQRRIMIDIVEDLMGAGLHRFPGDSEPCSQADNLPGETSWPSVHILRGVPASNCSQPTNLSLTSMP